MRSSDQCRPRGRTAWWFAVSAAAVLAAAQPAAVPPSSRLEAPEHEIKAAFLYNFTRYIAWPGPTRTGAFHIAVLGDSPIVTALQSIAATRTVAGRPIEVHALPAGRDLGEPDLVFLSASATRHLADVRDRLAGKPVLTVAETPGATLRGAAISFVIREGAVRFEINERLLRALGFTVSSQLLKLAVPAEGQR